LGTGVAGAPRTAAACPAGEQAAPQFDLQALSRPPATSPAEGFSADGVRAFFYEGPPFQGRPTRVFAYYGAPQAAPGTKVPALVLIHGGGGSAFDRWVRVWTARGYAAIAMDLCGCVPRGTYGHWERQAQGGPPGWDACFDQLDWPLADQWPYQAVSAVTLAHSLLRSFPEVDAERTGVTGISWGGYLTCLVAGVDQRFKFAVPVYGCGFLAENSAWLPRFAKLGPENAARWSRWWDPSAYLPRAGMPMLWVNGTNDFAYPMDSWQKSYRLPPSPRSLCLRVRMPHGHGPAGENPEEIHAFAKASLQHGPSLARVTGQGREGTNIWVTFTPAGQIARAELNWTCDAGKWQDRKWDTLPATLDTEQHRVTAVLPADTRVYYVNLVDEHGLVVSTEHQVLPEK
jgi:pimeloyl-ACP methyl ester carboxylesterase